MECKDDISVNDETPVHSINRNIVECKDRRSSLLLPAKKVLIETLWNVKKGSSQSDLSDYSINRNIVECKDMLGQLLQVLSAVLIETLWNVKLNCISIQMADL